MRSEDLKVRKVSPFTPVDDNGVVSVRTHYLSWRKKGLRITLTKNNDTGLVLVVLVEGDTRKPNKHKVYRNLKLVEPSEHYLDIVVSSMVKYASTLKDKGVKLGRRRRKKELVDK